MRKPLSRPGQDEYGTSQTSIRHHPPKRGAMRRNAAAPIHTGGVAVRHVGPRDATCVPPSVLTFILPASVDPNLANLQRANLPARPPRPACQAFFRRKFPSLPAEG